MAVGLRGYADDINGCTIAVNGVLPHICNMLGIPTIPIYTEEDRLLFNDLIATAEQYPKINEYPGDDYYYGGDGLFAAEIRANKEKVAKGVYKDVEAHDVVKYGIIPELVGRLPVIVSLDNLDEEALVRIIKEPKNALYKQYQKLFSLDGIELEFEEEAFRAIAHLAIERNTGARGLRSIVEGIMMQPMFDFPSDKSVKKVIITAKYVKGEEPITVVREN
jgi:hypothetical protein